MADANYTHHVMVLGVGAFTHGVLQVLRDRGAKVCTYLTRDHANYSPSLAGPVFNRERYPNPCQLVREQKVDYVIPMSINWHSAEWAKELISTGIPILSPAGEGIRLERERDFARQLCSDAGVPFPKSHVAANLQEALEIVRSDPRPYVLKNTLCSPESPLHTVICETPDDTESWLARVDDSEGIFLQEFMGRREAGHIAFVSGGEIYPLVTNQEYKRAFNGDMGIVAGAPMGGLVEQDQEDKYGLARDLLYPLLPWFRKSGFHGPVQVTAIKNDDKWYVLEYNVRIGVTCGPIILRMLQDPLGTLEKVVNNKKVSPDMNPEARFGCSLTLAAFGYPYGSVEVPPLPVDLREPLDCDLWWNEVAPDPRGKLHITGQRIADVTCVAGSLDEAIRKAYENIRKLRCVGSYYRTDIGQSLWPPGHD